MQRLRLLVAINLKMDIISANFKIDPKVFATGPVSSVRKRTKIRSNDLWNSGDNEYIWYMATGFC